MMLNILLFCFLFDCYHKMMTVTSLASATELRETSNKKVRPYNLLKNNVVEKARHVVQRLRETSKKSGLRLHTQNSCTDLI